MTYLALARKWRPKTFSEVMGQTHVVQALSNALDSGRVHHAFLFTGTRGVGKTTLARIFAKSLNCEEGMSANPCGVCSVCTHVDQGSFIDLIEVDAASRTGIDDMRELLDNVQYAPTQGKFKVYLIDEIHMLSKSSFNALLKTLEEPPEHVKFLFATTDPQKLPVTVLSRCLQFNLKALQPSQISEQMATILSAEQISYDEEGLNLLARSADGSLRDGLSLLEQAIAQGGGEVTKDHVRDMLGTVKSQHMDALLGAIVTSNANLAMEIIHDMASYAADFSLALDQLLVELHHISLAQITPDALEYKVSDTEKYGLLADKISAENLQLCYQICLISKRDLSLAPDYRSGFEMALLRILAFKPSNKTTENITNTAGTVTETVTTGSPESESTASPASKAEVSSVSESAAKQEPEPALEAKPTPVAGVKSEPVVLNNPVTQAHIKTEQVATQQTETPVSKTPEEITSIPQRSADRQEPGLPTMPSQSDVQPSDRIAPVAPAAQTNTQQSVASEAGNTPASAPSYKAAPNFAKPRPAAQQPANDSMGMNNAANATNSVQTEQSLVDAAAQAHQASYEDDEDEENLRIPRASEAEWAGFVELLSLNGLVKEFAMNMACDNINTQPMTLLLDPSFQYMQNPAREETVKKEVRKHKGEDWQVNIIVSKTVQETPSERIKRLSNDKRRDTKEDIKNDSTVQSVMNTLGMNIDESSIKLK